MEQFNAKVVEKFAFKADKKGFFKEWWIVTSSIKENEDISLDDAAEKAYRQLKLQGSD